MVRARSQLENFSKEELIEKLSSVEDISSKLSDLTSSFDDFLRRYEIHSSELYVSKNCNYLLTERFVQLERNAVNNASIGDHILESSVCKALSLTGHEVKPDDVTV